MIGLPERGRRYLQIAQDLADQINSGAYKTGDRLPPERELATQLQVSRTTVREALLALEIMRFVEIRVGSGVFVLSEGQRDREQGNLVKEEAVGPYEVLEARRLIEGFAAYSAAQKIDAETLKELEAANDRMAKAINDIPQFDAADADFHALIARASGNALIEIYVSQLWSMRQSKLWTTWYAKTRKVENRQRSIEHHSQIISTLKRGHADMAQTAMRAHLDVLAERFFDLNF
jgi:DNA-binding FadR family transcriptional regulator